MRRRYGVSIMSVSIAYPENISKLVVLLNNTNYITILIFFTVNAIYYLY